MKRRISSALAWVESRQRPDAWVATIIVGIGLVARVLWMLYDRRIRITNDGALYLIGARSWLDGSALPVYRERQSLFTVIWAPFLDLPHAGVALMLIQGVIASVAIGIFYLGLRRFGASVRLGGSVAALTALAPTAVYYEHTLLSESLSFSAILVVVWLLAWALRPLRALRVGVVSLVLLGLAGSLRNSFLILAAALVVASAAVVLYAVLVRRASVRRHWRQAIRVAAAVAVGAAMGMLGTSAAYGVIAHRPLTEQAVNSMTMSSYTSAFKFGPLLDCPARENESHATQSICTDQAVNAPAMSSYDDLMWFGEVHKDWADSSVEEFRALAPEYRVASREAVLDDPVGAARIVINDALGTLMPIYHEYFFTAPYPVSILPQVAPNLKVADDFGLQAKDTLYRVAGFFDAPRVLALLAALVLLVAVRRDPRAAPAALLAGAWLAYWAVFALTAVPSARFVFPLDPLLVASIVISVVCLSTSRTRSLVERTEITSPSR